MVLAVVLSLCSQADAFVAASFTSFPEPARLAFLAMGPMLDLKLFLMWRQVFEPDWCGCCWSCGGGGPCGLRRAGLFVAGRWRMNVRAGVAALWRRLDGLAMAALAGFLGWLVLAGNYWMYLNPSSNP
jgi:hypothetical protein